MVLCRFCGGSPLTVPTFNNVADFRRIAERSEFSDGAMQILWRVAADCSDLAAVSRLKFAF